MLPDGNGYGVALFRSRGNVPLTPRTDDDLTITAFDEFYNEASYTVSHSLPPDFEGRRYVVGDKVPIPFVTGGRVEVASAGQPSADFLQAHREAEDPRTVAAVAAILAAAESGAYRKAAAERIVTRLRLEHDEILAGEPAHSAYWVQKLGQAAAAVKRMPKSERPVGAGMVAERISAWLRKFGSKSDVQMLGRLLKVVAEGDTKGRVDVQASIFSALLARFGEGALQGKQGDKILAAARLCLPGGLYGFYLRNGLPGNLSVQDRRRAHDLPRYLMEVITEGDRRDSSFNHALALAGAMFGDADLPIDISGVVGQMALNKARTLRDNLMAAYRYDSRHLSVKDATKLLADNNQVVCLYRILHGEERLMEDWKKSHMSYGLTSADIEFLMGITRRFDGAK